MSAKCNKCGAEIPDDAVFCPACGLAKPIEKTAPKPQPVVTAPPAPKAEETTTQQSPQPAPQSYARPVAPRQPIGSNFEELANTLFSKFFIMLGLCIGTLLAFISGVIIIYNYNRY